MNLRKYSEYNTMTTSRISDDDDDDNNNSKNYIIIIIIMNCNWVVTRWQWLFYMYTKYEIGY